MFEFPVFVLVFPVLVLVFPVFVLVFVELEGASHTASSGLR